MLATAGEIARITPLLADVLSTSSYMLPQRAADTEQRIRRMLRRLKLSAQDVEAWLGILRHVQWEMRSGKKQRGVTCPSGDSLKLKIIYTKGKCLIGSCARASLVPSAEPGSLSNGK